MNLNENNINALLALGRKATDRVLEIYNQAFSVEFKADDSPLTLADQEADRLFQEGLKQFGLPIVSEEQDFDASQDFSRCWVVDPIDGTKEFVARNGMFTLNVALIEEGQPVLGLLIAPAYAGQEAGAWLGGPNWGLWHWPMEAAWIWSPEKAQVQPKASKPGPSLVGSRSDFRENLENWEQELAKGKPLHILKVGSSLKFTFVASGKADFYPRSHHLSAWDIAAGHALVLGGGGQMLELENRRPLRYNLPQIKMPGFLALAPTTLD
jgi:3'(2'), 5'-bisphosphate nucleotidase